MLNVKWIAGILAMVVAIATPLALALTVSAHDADEFELEMQPGPFAPGAEGELEFSVVDGVLSGEFEAKGLPFSGSHVVYVLWFVRTDTGDKAFLGPIIDEDSILSLTEGELRFSAPHFTTGPNTGSGITLGASGTNFFVLIAENMIDTSMPFPVSPPPSSFALTATV